MRALLIGISLVMTLASSVTAQDAKKRSEGRPADLNSYSLRFWPQDSLKFGQPVSTQTPYGTLTCMSRGNGKRVCSLK